MAMQSWHKEQHLSGRNNWLRAGVLGANDGLISVASLLMGLAAGGADSKTLGLTGLASVTAGAVSMAAGEYVSVSSQADTEKADLARESHELKHNPDKELAELAKIYEERGMMAQTAADAAAQVMAKDALGAHARDEIGISEEIETNALQAAGASALAFCCGALLPLLLVMVLPAGILPLWLAVSTLFGLAMLGALSAKLGGAPYWPAICRMAVWGAAAMAVTAGIGRLFGVSAG